MNRRTYIGAERDEGDAPAGPLFEAPFDVGMSESARAGSKWTPREIGLVGDAIARLAATREPFTADDVWALLPGVTVTKGLAARLNAAARRGIIRNTGETRTAKRGGAHDHAQRLTVWVGSAA